MSGWTKRQVGNIELIHHSTSSLIEMIITSHEPPEPYQSDMVKYTIWLDYKDFDDLKKAIELTQ